MTPFWRLGICNMLFYLCSQFTGIFINIYIFRDFHSLRINGAFNAIMYGTWILAYTLGTRLSAKSTRANIPVASIFGVASLLLLLVGPRGNIGVDLLVGAVLGICYGFYYVAYNLLLFAFSTTGERGQSIAKLGILTSLVAVAMPALSGYVIAFMGYRVAFLLMVCLFLVIFAMSFGFPPIRSTPIQFPTFSHTRQDGVRPRIPVGFGTFALALLTTGMYVHFQQFSSGVLTYSFGSGITGAGWLNTLYAGLSFFANAVIGYGIRGKSDRHRQTIGWLGATLATLGTALLFFASPSTLIAFNSVVSVSNPLFMSLLTGQQFDAVGKLYANRATGFLVREWFYSFARISLFTWVACFGFQAGNAGFTILVAVLCCMPLLATLWNLKASRLVGDV
ncbi:MAG: MFS transporter, partial [Alicyclobacillus sp.]|nr:MFS transporter [Alicyclobacillus sp.]